MYNIQTTHQIRTAIQSELRDGNAPRIESLHRAITAYKGKMFRVDGSKTVAFEKHLQSLELSKPSSGYYHQNGLKVIIQSLQLRAGYSSLELHIRATSSTEGKEGTSYTEHIIYLGKFSYENYNYDFNRPDLNSIGNLYEQIHAYNKYSLEEILTAKMERDALLVLVKETEAKMPIWSY